MLPMEYLLRQTPEQARRSGARGGRTTARNRHPRRIVPKPERVQITNVSTCETMAAAILLLDAQFPWLRGAEQRQRRSVVRDGAR